MKNVGPWLFAATALLMVQLASAQSAAVDPYTGKPLALEQLSVQLDTAKLETALLKEQVEQAHLHRELQSLSRAGKSHPRARSALRHTDSSRAGKADAPSISVVSILGVGARRSALLRVGESTLSVRNGEETPYGTISIPDARHVLLGSQEFSLP